MGLMGRGTIDLIFAFLICPLCTGCTSQARKCDGKVPVIARPGSLWVVVVFLDSDGVFGRGDVGGGGGGLGVVVMGA